MDDSVEYIVIGDTVYMKTGTSGKWEQTKIPGATFLEEEEVTAQSIGETIQDVRWVRSDEIEGKAINVYKYHSTTQSSDIELNSQTE